MIKKILAILLLVCFASITPVWAENPTQAQINEALLQLPSVRWIPGNPLYFVVLVKEKISWLIKPSPVKKAQFDLTTSGKRLKEAFLLAQKNDFERSKNSLSIYKETLEKMSGEVGKAKKQGQEAGKLLNEIQNSFLAQKIVLSQLYATENAKNQMGQEILDSQKSLTKSAEELGKLRPDIFVPFKEASKSAHF